MNRLSLAAKTLVALTALAGAAVLLYGALHLRPAAPFQFFVYLALALAASRLRVKVPGVSGIMSVNLPFFLIAAVKLSVGEALLIAFLSSLAQSVAKPGRNKSVKIVFNVATLTNAVGLAALTFTTASDHHLALPVSIVAAGAAYLLGNTVLITLILWLAEGERPAAVWTRMVELTFPYYLLSASVAATACVSADTVGWTIALLVLAAMYLTYRSYRAYFATPGTDSRKAAATAG